MASSGKSIRGHTRWRRFAAIMLPGLAIAGLLVALTEQSVLAVSFSISGTPFVVTAKQLNGHGFEQFAVLQAMRGHANQVPVTTNAIRTATLSHLCQSVTVGPFTLRITAGNGSTPVSASDLIVTADQLSGNAVFRHINIGQDASTLTEVPGVRGPAGDFAQQAVSVTITNLHQHAFATTAGTFTLPGLSLGFGKAC